jgi:hypothetical protein
VPLQFIEPSPLLSVMSFGNLSQILTKRQPAYVS